MRSESDFTEEIKNNFLYDPKTGFIYRFISGSRHSIRKVEASPTKDNYLYASFNERKFPQHRIAWLLFNGEWPNGEIDHINGNSLDNRFENLRDVSHAINGRNVKLSALNKSGASGVRWKKAINKWVAEITVGGKKTHLGCFESVDDAIKARKFAEYQNGFHNNHGRTGNLKLEDLR